MKQKDDVMMSKKRIGLVCVVMAVMISSVADAATGNSKYKFSYYANGRICVGELGKLDGKNPITQPPEKSWEDFKPSWSKTGDRLVFFRRVKNDADVANWLTILCTIKTDGTDLEYLTDDKHTNFNPTWTRDGKNQPVWNRRHPTGRYYTMRGKVGSKPETADVLTNKDIHTWMFSCLKDGRMLVQTYVHQQGYALYLMTPKKNGKSTFEKVDDGGLFAKGQFHRISFSPDETKITYGYAEGDKQHREPGHQMCVADFDIKKRKISNHKIFANKPRKENIWFGYPRWTKDAKHIIYFSYETGRGQLYLYTLKTDKIERVSTDPNVDYRYPHAEGVPK